MPGWGCSARLLILTGQQCLSIRQWVLCAYGLAQLQFSFFFFPSVCQNVSQSEPSKTTLLPEGASDGFVNNFDQLKGEKKHHFNYSLFRNCQFQFGGFSVSFLLPPSPPTKQSKPEKQPRQKKRDQAGYAHTLSILLTTFSPEEVESPAHTELCWKGAHSFRLQLLLWRDKHEPPYTGFSFNSLLTNFVNGLNAI